MIVTISVGFLLIILMLNQVHAFRIMTVGDFDCSDRSLETMNSILSYLNQNKTDQFIFLGT